MTVMDRRRAAGFHFFSLYRNRITGTRRTRSKSRAGLMAVVVGQRQVDRNAIC